MKPCSKNRKPIAWLVLGTLNASKAAALREHLALCEGCRHYRDEISNVANQLTTAKPDSNIQASELFHRRVAEKLRGIESAPALENLAAWLRQILLNWRLALPATAALLIAIFALVNLKQNPPAPPFVSPAVQDASASRANDDVVSTLADYQLAASESLEKLDELLTRQGNRPLPPAPIYTAATYKLDNTSF